MNNIYTIAERVFLNDRQAELFCKKKILQKKTLIIFATHHKFWPQNPSGTTKWIIYYKQHESLTDPIV